MLDRLKALIKTGSIRRWSRFHPSDLYFTSGAMRFAWWKVEVAEHLVCARVEIYRSHFCFCHSTTGRFHYVAQWRHSFYSFYPNTIHSIPEWTAMWRQRNVIKQRAAICFPVIIGLLLVSSFTIRMLIIDTTSYNWYHSLFSLTHCLYFSGWCRYLLLVHH